MSIILSLIARSPDIVLSEYYELSGNFPPISRIILQKLKPNCKYSIDYDKYKFHYINENKITYLCLCDQMSDNTAFAFLADIKKKLLQSYEIENILSLNAFQLKEFSEIYYNANPNRTKTGDIIEDLKAAKDIIVENIDKLVDRDNRLNIIVNKSENIGKISQNINNFSISIRKEEEKKRNQMILMVAAGVAILLFLLYILF